MQARYLSVNGLRRIGRLYKVGQASAGDPDGVARAVSEAWVIARSIKDAFVRAWAGHDIAKAQTSAGDIKGNYLDSLTAVLSAHPGPVPGPLTRRAEGASRK